MRSGSALAGLVLAWLTTPWAAAQPGVVDLAPYLQQPAYERVKISPDGANYAVTVPLEDRTVLAIVRRADLQPVTKITGRKDSVVADFWWAGSERVVVAMAHKRGSRDQPVAIGELHAVNADGRYPKLLASPYGVDDGTGNSVSYRSQLEHAVYMLDTLAGRSPVHLADRIKAPVFLAAGGRDERAPLEHSERMEKALERAGVPVESLYFPSEGHGFYTEPHRREYYTRLLDFLGRHLGGATAQQQ